MSKYDELVEQYHDRVPEGFDRWVRGFGIQEEVAPNLYTVVTWVKHCSWVYATKDQRILACMDLFISFFYLDDYQEEDYLELFEDFDRNLAGEPIRSSRPTVAAHADLLRRMEEVGRPMDAFLHLRRQLIEEYRLRNAVMRGKATVTFDRFWQCRMVTIYVQQWVDLWLLIWEHQLSDDDRANRELAEAIRLSTTFYFLGNDLYSFERDAAKGEPNLVCLWRDENGVSLESAASSIEEMRIDALNEFHSVANVLVGGTSTENLRCAGRLLRWLVDNASTARHDNPKRYVKPDRLLTS